MPSGLKPSAFTKSTNCSRLNSVYKRCRAANAARASVQSANRPCIVVADFGSGADGAASDALQQLGQHIRSHTPECEVLVVSATAAGSTSSPPLPQPSHHQQHNGSPRHLTFDHHLPLIHHPEAPLPLTFSLGGGATPADCVLAAVDHSAGLAAQLGLSPVLLVTGVHRGPALGADAGDSSHPALALARHASLLGLPCIAACLATPSRGAPLQPAVAATARLAAAAVRCLRSTGGWPRARNLPRAHFPFPTRGRWSLGREVAAPPAVRAAAAAAAGGGNFAAADCWALGDEGGIWSGANGLGPGAGPGEGATDEAASRQLLREAFAEGDLLLLVNCPPTWVGAGDGTDAGGGRGGGRGGPEPFAAVRPGVLWPCYQVEAVTTTQHVGGAGDGNGDGGAGGGKEAQGHVSWGVDESDLYGRSLPRQDFGDTRDRAGAFVGQDNTASLVAAAGSGSGPRARRVGAGSRGSSRSGGQQGSNGSWGRSTNGSSSGYSRSNWRSALEAEVGGRASTIVAAADEEEEEVEAQVQVTAPVESHARGSSSERHGSGDWGVALASLPSSFVLRRGTTLGDHAACGDVEAVMARRAAVAALPAWPYAHPFSLVDRLGAAALEEGREGLPLWLVEMG